MELLQEIKETIREAIADVEVHILDPMDDGVHLEALVIAHAFEGKTLIQQHQMVMQPLRDHFASSLHALGLKTFTPDQWRQVKHQYHEVQMHNETQNIKDKILNDIQSDRVVLYMKGTKTMPMCGFSARVVQILESIGVDFVAYNVLEDEAVRQGIKDFANWPTIPQLYIDAEFVGGCDIVTQLHETGELQKLIEKQP